MATFIINPHGRLQEWIADSKNYFKDAGLIDYSLQAHALLTKDTPKIATDGDSIKTKREGAYQTYETGRDASVSCACHWTVNMAAAAAHGRLWGECYSISPCAIMVSPESNIKTPADLANIDVHVGYQSGSHYATVQSLEKYLTHEQISLKFSGNPSERIDLMLDGDAQAATVFGPQLYILEQLGYRKILDCTFMIAAMIKDNADLDQVACYYQALRRAQSDLDRDHFSYLHFYLNELPERHTKLIDVERFGPGERLVFEPYTEEMYLETQKWILDREVFEFDQNTHAGSDTSAFRSNYHNAVVRVNPRESVTAHL